ncbi:MAG: hypothetical protein HC913_02540 [Microscillaceae bacterium]|nr:hypothetical protein [Microscillaceae bacterium]
MNKQTQILTNSAQQPTGGNDAFNEIDLGKILGILRKSIPWIILLNALSILGAYTYLRYYKPIYESSSSLKLTIKNQSSLQGIYGILGANNDDNLKQLAGEIEFIRSDIIIDEIIRKLKLDISYHTQGNFLDSEIYPHSPFQIEAEVLNPAFCNQKIFVRFLNDKSYQLRYARGEEEYQQTFRIGKSINTPDFKLMVSFRNAYQKEMSAQNYFFIVYSKPALQANLRKNLKVGITKPEARIIDISFTDHTPAKAQHIVAAIDSAYMEKSVEEKNKSNRQQISFLNDQLKQFEDSLTLYESQIQNFFLENKTKNIDDKLEKSIQNIEKLVAEKQRLAKNLAFCASWSSWWCRKPRSKTLCRWCLS